MKPLALAFAALMLGSGCIVTHDHEPCNRSISTDWSFTYWSDGGGAWVMNAGCSAAAVSTVDVWMNGQFVENLPCSTGGITITDVPEGTHVVHVEGLASDGAVLYRDSLSVPAGSCGDHYVPSYPAEGFVNVDYSASGGCTSGPCYLWLSAHDDIANQVAVAYSGSGGARTFPYPNDVVLRLPVGTYTLDWMQLVSSQTWTEEARACILPTFNVEAAQSTVLTPPVALVPTATSCQ